jgi:hypothetical protein
VFVVFERSLQILGSQIAMMKWERTSDCTWKAHSASAQASVLAVSTVCQGISEPLLLILEALEKVMDGDCNPCSYNTETEPIGSHN